MPSRKRRAAAPIVHTMKASEFKAKCLVVMDEVQARRVEVIVTKRGKPVAKLVPVDDAPAGAFGFMRGTVVAHADLVAPDDDAWRETSDPLDER
jgi:prevent-host-death family protein